MEQLTPAQLEVIGLRFFGGLTSREVGQILNKSDGSVREMQRAAIEPIQYTASRNIDKARQTKKEIAKLEDKEEQLSKQIRDYYHPKS